MQNARNSSDIRHLAIFVIPILKASWYPQGFGFQLCLDEDSGVATHHFAHGLSWEALVQWEPVVLVPGLAHLLIGRMHPELVDGVSA